MAKSKAEKAEVSPSAVPAVQKYIDAENALTEHINQNSDWYERFTELVEARNSALEQADKAVRPLEVTCGPFQYVSTSQKVNAEKLFEEIGEEDFKKMGGYLVPVTSYRVDKERFQMSVARGDVPQEVLEVVVTTTASFRKPEPYKLP